MVLRRSRLALRARSRSARHERFGQRSEPATRRSLIERTSPPKAAPGRRTRSNPPPAHAREKSEQGARPRRPPKPSKAPAQIDARARRRHRRGPPTRRPSMAPRREHGAAKTRREEAQGPPRPKGSASPAVVSGRGDEAHPDHSRERGRDMSASSGFRGICSAPRACAIPRPLDPLKSLEATNRNCAESEARAEQERGDGTARPAAKARQQRGRASRGGARAHT